MAFVEGFKKFMGMSPLDDSTDDDDEIGTSSVAAVHNFDYGSQLDNLDKLDGLNGYDTTTSYHPSTDMGVFSREESNKVVNMNQANLPQVVLVKPERFEDATGIADHLQAKHTVVVNTDSVSQDVRRRLIDFLSGVAYAETGTIKKASNTTFVITPSTVDIMGESVQDEVEPEPQNGGTYY